jgi:hypothetical protein
VETQKKSKIGSLYYRNNVVIGIVHALSSRAVLIQRLEPAVLYFEERVRLAVLDESTVVHDDDFVEVEDCVELVRDCDDGV